jgi:L-threonylcarbamoyladenylate synthase
VYGLGANALDGRAVARIFAAKGRPSHNPLIVHVPDESTARELVREWPDRASRLARAFWPGPLTLVLRKRDVVPDVVTAGIDSVALRVPAHPVALALLRATALPLAAPSANRSTELSPTSAQHVVRSLGDRVALILDAGPTEVGIESTVVDLRGSTASILRPGILGARELEPIIGALTKPEESRGDDARPAPGMLDRHYAPRARLVLFSRGEIDKVADEARALAERGTQVGMLVIASTSATGAVALVTMPPDASRYAHELYATLHDLDERGIEVVYAELPPNGSGWDGVRDRLERASREPG